MGLTSSSSLILIILGLITYVIWSRKRALDLWKRLGIPGPKPSFWFGNAKQLTYGRMNTMEVLSKWQKEYGRVFGYYIGLRPALNIIDPDIVKEVFIKQFSNFVNRPDALQSEQNLARLRDNKWKEIRKIMNPIFTTKKLKTLSNLVNEVEETLIDVLNTKMESNEPIPSYKTAQGLTFQIITKTAFAMDIDSQRNESDPFYQNVKAWLSYPFSVFIFFILMFPGLGFLFRFLNKFDTQYKFWNDLTAHVKGIINYRRSNPETRPVQQDLLGLMLEASEGKMEVGRELIHNILRHEEPQSDDIISEKLKRSHQKFLMTDTQMVDNLILFLMAGFDSTSNTIAFAIHFLAKYPNIQDRAFTEVKSEIGESEFISVEDTKRLKYIEQIVFETLRMYPPIPIFLHRQAAETITIKGITIPKGAVVEFPPWLLHRDPEYWPSPDTFDPDRFSPENQTESQNYAFVPFGVGPRMCLGAKFAMIEAITTIAKILQKFVIIPSDRFNDALKVQVKNILLNPAEEIYVSLQPRKY